MESGTEGGAVNEVRDERLFRLRFERAWEGKREYGIA